MKAQLQIGNEMREGEYIIRRPEGRQFKDDFDGEFLPVNSRSITPILIIKSAGSDKEAIRAFKSIGGVIIQEEGK